MILDVGESVSQVKPPFFLDRLLPRLREGLNADAILNTLSDPLPGDTTAAIVNDRWSALRQDPADDSRWEPTVFEQLDLVTDAIHRATGLPDDQRTVVFRSSGSHAPSCSERDNSSEPDGFAAERGIPHADLRWHNIATAGEYKKKMTMADIDDNRKKLMWSLSHMMRDDVRRRFAFGYTIENTTMRLWFCNRSEFIVSLPFDFMKERYILVHFILSVMYADPADLGWDPTIVRHRCAYTGTFYYDITVHPEGKATEVYRTKQVLANIGAEAPLGRGTRVWRAVKLVDGRESDIVVAIKDSWIDSDRKREGDIDQMIKASAPAGSVHAKLFKKYMLRIECYGDVIVNNVKDETDALHRRGVPIPAEDGRLTLSIHSPRVKLLSVRPVVNAVPNLSNQRTLEEQEQEQPILCYSAKTHHRTVFRDVGKPLHNEKSLQIAFRALRNLVYLLKSLHACGWVHCDISSGNILLVNGELKLGDFEYAKHEGDQTGHGVRTGTPYFMSTEVDGRKYHYLHHKRVVEPTKKSRADRLALMDPHPAPKPAESTAALKAPALVATPRMSATLSFIYNPLHDLESVWWLSLWALVARRYVQQPDDDPEQFFLACRNQSTFTSLVFYSRGNRFECMRIHGTFQDHVNTLALPAVKAAAAHLEFIRATLTEYFTKAEQAVENIKFATVAAQRDAGGASLYDRMFDALDDITKLMEADKREVKVLDNSFTFAKRNRDELEAGTDRNALSAVDLTGITQPIGGLSAPQDDLNDRPKKSRKMANMPSTPGAGPSGSNG
ncbi:hypothetical protein PsYK624_136020 [Phanerochaete sordida]|uniref:Fungal-type protein kinase domain-containing protein n=1 Tax=Phanerochaete sordida TaxID=48140 RepID=A0A9P3GLA8_9APHY|nr:hypothetical protein PsYK624_136020 [Phanerochaete sordida]